MTDGDSGAEEHDHWMRIALNVAREGGELGEIPVGAILVRQGEELGRGFNQPISAHDPTAHAEIVALRAAGQAVGNYRLPGTTAYVTVEPCSMCAGALVHARVERLVFGAREPKAGAVMSTAHLLDNENLNHRIHVIEGVLQAESGQLLRSFFSGLRGRSEHHG